jgi:hypothetical protein
MTTEHALRAVKDIIRENQENGELEGILNRYRIAALNRLVRLAEAASIDAERRTGRESQPTARARTGLLD